MKRLRLPVRGRDVLQLTPEACASLLGLPLPNPTPIPADATCRVCRCYGTRTHPLSRCLNGNVEHLWCPPPTVRPKLWPQTEGKRRSKRGR